MNVLKLHHTLKHNLYTKHVVPFIRTESFFIVHTKLNFWQLENSRSLQPTFPAPVVSRVNGFLVSKETVVLRRWGRSKQKFGFIKRVDKC